MLWPWEFGRPAGDFGHGRAGRASKTGLGYAVAMRGLCGGAGLKIIFASPPTRTRTGAAGPREVGQERARLDG